MDFYDKYLKYKNKYINLKKSLIGGAPDIKCEFEIKCSGFAKENDTDITNIKISFEYNNYEKSLVNHKIIKNFDMKIKKRSDTDYSSLKLPYNEFIVNNLFFENKLNYEGKDIELNKLGIYTSDQLVMSECEKLMIADDFLKIIYVGEKVKRFIESYFRKNNCINLQSYEFFISLKNYKEILSLYIYLVIITQYFRIELFKKYLYDTKPEESKRIDYKYNVIYSHIPKYLEAEIPVDKIEFGFNSSTGIVWTNCNQTLNGINGNDFKIIFDTGNSTSTLVSKKFLQFIGILDSSDNINPLYSSSVIKNFIKPKSHGIGGTSASKQTNIFYLQFKFTDSKINNSKIYNIYCFNDDNPTFDVLFGQETMSALYDDGYSIKWHSSVAAKSVRLGTSNILKKEFYNNLLLKDPKINLILKFHNIDIVDLIKNFQLFEEFQKYYSTFFLLYFQHFITGKYFDTNNLSPIQINLIKNNLKPYYLNLLKLENELRGIEFKYGSLYASAIKDDIVDTFKKFMENSVGPLDWKTKMSSLFA